MKLPFFFLFFFLFVLSYSQNKDIIIYEDNKVYTQKWLDSIIENEVPIRSSVFKKILESNNKLVGWTRYYAGMSSLLTWERKFDSVIYYTSKAIDTFNKAKIKHALEGKEFVRANNLKANAYYFLKDYEKALIYYQRTLDLNKKYPFKWIVFAHAGIAESHLSMGNDSLALAKFLEVAKDTAYINLAESGVTTYKNIGYLYDKYGDINKARDYYNKSLEKSLSSDFKEDIAFLYGSIGHTFHMDSDYRKALSNYKKAIDANKTYGIAPYKRAEFDNEYYQCYIKLFAGDKSGAIEDLKSLIKDIKSVNNISEYNIKIAVLAIDLLGLSYQKQKNFGEYQNLLKETFSFYDAYTAEHQRINLQNLEIQYQTKEKDASIAQLEQNEEQQQTIIKQQRYLAFGLGGLLLLLSGFGFLFWKQRKLKNQYEKENLEQRLLRSQMNPHFIGNAMNTVSGLVEKNSEDTIPFINKLSNLFRLMLTNSREELVSLEEELIIIQNYLELQSNFSNRFEFNISTDQNEDLEEILVPPMLIQPLVENAIIHGLSNKNEDGEITVHVAKDIKENLLKVTVNDNGNGFDKSMLLNPNQNKKSISGNIVKERIEILKKKFKVNTRLTTNSSSKGTKVELYLPYIVDV